MKDYFATDNHISALDGGDPVTGTCPNCSADAYHYESQICAVCEESVDHECSFCGSVIIPAELDDDGLCAYCRNRFLNDD